MAFVTSKEAYRIAFEALKNEDLVLRLYTNEVDISFDTSSNEFEEPVKFAYSSISLPTEKWIIRSANDNVSLIYPKIRFSFKKDIGIVIGYYITKGNKEFIFAEEFEDGPYEIEREGQTITVSIKINAKGE